MFRSKINLGNKNLAFMKIDIIPQQYYRTKLYKMVTKNISKFSIFSKKFIIKNNFYI